LAYPVHRVKRNVFTLKQSSQKWQNNSKNYEGYAVTLHKLSQFTWGSQAPMQMELSLWQKTYLTIGDQNFCYFNTQQKLLQISALSKVFQAVIPLGCPNSS